MLLNWLNVWRPKYQWSVTNILWWYLRYWRYYKIGSTFRLCEQSVSIFIWKDEYRRTEMYFTLFHWKEAQLLIGWVFNLRFLSTKICNALLESKIFESNNVLDRIFEFSACLNDQKLNYMRFYTPRC